MGRCGQGRCCLADLYFSRCRACRGRLRRPEVSHIVVGRYPLALAGDAGAGSWGDGGDVMTEDELDLSAVRRRLEALLAECRTASTATAGDRKPVELDQTTVGRLSRVDAMQRQAMAQAADRQRQVQIQRLRAALERLDEGEYGACVRCGHDIAPRRLEADPAVPTCIACARG